MDEVSGSSDNGGWRGRCWGCSKEVSDVRPRLSGGGSRRGACRSDLSCLPVEGPRPIFKRSATSSSGGTTSMRTQRMRPGLKPRLGIEELTAECMADQGLEYTPFHPAWGVLTRPRGRLGADRQRVPAPPWLLLLRNDPRGISVQRGARGGTGRGELKRGGALRAI